MDDWAERMLARLGEDEKWQRWQDIVGQIGSAAMAVGLFVAIPAAIVAELVDARPVIQDWIGYAAMAGFLGGAAFALGGFIVLQGLRRGLPSWKDALKRIAVVILIIAALVIVAAFPVTLPILALLGPIVAYVLITRRRRKPATSQEI